jgi:5-methylcytosine-specific restriction endonuclease McrA
MTKKRNYKEEYENYHGKKEQIENRAKRNAARSKMGLAKGDPKEIDHKIPLSKGGSNKKSNLRAVSQKTNREKGNK